MNKNQSQHTLFKVIPLKNLPVSDEVRRKLNGWSKRANEPQLIDYRTPFFAVKAADSAVVLQKARISGVTGVKPVDRVAIVEEAYRTVLPHIKHIPQYVQWEEKYRKYAVSSRSIRVPFSDRKEGTLVPYFRNAQRKLSDDAVRALDEAVYIWRESIRKSIPANSLNLLTFEKAMEELPGTTNWGMPYLVSGTEVSQGKIEVDNRPKYRKIAERLAYSELSDKDILENAFWLGWRGQESNDEKDRYEGQVKPKQRSVWAEGHAWSILGNRMKPFLEARKKMTTRAALVSQAAVDDVIYNVWNDLKSDEIVISWDGSSFDTWMMRDVALKIAEVIIESFNCDKREKEACMRYFEHIFSDPIITPEGLWWGLHGMPSGTTFTNELDSCYNEVLAIAVGLLPKKINTLGIKLTMITDQGDDAVLVCQCPSLPKLDISKLAEVLSACYAELNMSVNPKKQRISRTEAEYLKRLHLNTKKESYRSYVWTAIGLCNLEHAKAWRYDMYSARYIMQVANHYASLPGFNEFCKWVSEGDKELHIGVGIKGGCYAIFQRAGGVPVVLKRLGMTSYATHLGVEHSESEAKLAQSLSSALWVENENKKLMKRK